VVEHPVGENDVKLAVREWQRLDVGDLRIDAARPRRFDRSRREVDADDLGRADERRELTGAAAGVEHSPRVRLRNRCEHRVDRFAGVSQPAGPVEPATPEPVERRVLARDNLRVIDAPHQT
jgi:hypothetical protein